MSDTSSGGLRSLPHRLLVRAQVERNRKQLSDFIHDDFKGIETDGSIVSKDEEIEILMSTNFESGEVKEESVITEGGLMIVMGTTTFRSPGPDRMFRFTDVLLNGKLIASHTSEVT